MERGKVARLKFHHQGQESGCSKDFSASPLAHLLFSSLVIGRFFVYISNIISIDLASSRFERISFLASAILECRSLSTLGRIYVASIYALSSHEKRGRCYMSMVNMTRVECAVYSRYTHAIWIRHRTQTIQYRSTYIRNRLVLFPLFSYNSHFLSNHRRVHFLARFDFCFVFTGAYVPQRVHVEYPPAFDSK